MEKFEIKEEGMKDPHQLKNDYQKHAYEQIRAWANAAIARHT